MRSPGRSRDRAKPDRRTISTEGTPSTSRPARHIVGLMGVAAIVAVLLVSRIAVIPASIWEQDEAYFAAGVLRFEPAVNHPHPPWFPLWIALGKLATLAGVSPERGLAWLSAISSSLMFIPTAALFRLWMRRELAVAAALLGLFVPGIWLLSSRAFSEPLATALMVAAAACWLPPTASRRRLQVGSALAGLCVLVRPHFVLPLAALGGWVAISRRNDRVGSPVALPALAIAAAGFACVVLAAGGVGELAGALRTHAEYHFGGLENAALPPFGEWGLSRLMLAPLVAVVWIGLAVVGAATTIRRNTAAAAAVLALLAPLAVLAYVLADGGHPRYSYPIVVIASGFVVIGIEKVVGKRWVYAVGGGTLAAVVAVWPAMAVVRTRPSPVAAALDTAIQEAVRHSSVVVADGTLAAFVEHRRTAGGVPVTVLYDWQLGTDTPPPPAWATVAVFDSGHNRFVAESGKVDHVSCEQPVLRRVGQRRYMDLTIDVGAVTRPPSSKP